MQQDRPFVSLEPLGTGNAEIRTAIAFTFRGNRSRESRTVQAHFPLDERLGKHDRQC